jgi:hypothetical protein
MVSAEINVEINLCKNFIGQIIMYMYYLQEFLFYGSLKKSVIGRLPQQHYLCFIG